MKKKERELKFVVGLSTNQTAEIIKIEFNGSIIKCTPEHPFYINNNWIAAKDLKIGDKLFSLDGTQIAITSIISKKINEKVYNFEVEENHNYFVSESKILVHNNCWRERLQKFLAYAGDIVISPILGTLKSRVFD